MSTNQKIANCWKEFTPKETAIPKGTTFYSGIRSSSNIRDLCSFLKSKHSVWMSQSAFWVGEYCYRESQENPFKYLIKFTTTEIINTLEFPSNFHPADAFYERAIGKNGQEKTDYSKVKPDMPRDGGQPDHHVDKHFLEITKLLDPSISVQGYIRKSVDNQLGSIPGEIIEFSLLDANLICITEQIIPPSTKAELHQLIGPDKTVAGSVLFSEA